MSEHKNQECNHESIHFNAKVDVVENKMIITLPLEVLKCDRANAIHRGGKLFDQLWMEWQIKQNQNTIDAEVEQ